MAEWLNAVDSKSIVRVSVPGVQIPFSPPILIKAQYHLDIRLLFFLGVSIIKIETLQLTYFLFWKQE